MAAWNEEVTATGLGRGPGRGRPQVGESRPGEHRPSGEGRRKEVKAKRRGHGTLRGREVDSPGAGSGSRGPPSHRALGVDAAQMGLEAAHAPAAVAAQLQVAMALVGALHQERDGLGFRLHVGGAVGSATLPDARQTISQQPTTAATTVCVFGARAPTSATFYRDPAPGLRRQNALWLPPIG